jgi:hypothetical protein
MCRRHPFARLEGGEPGCSLPAETWTGSDGNDAGQPALHDFLEVFVEPRQG